MFKNKLKPQQNSSAINSAALQDHLLKQFNFGLIMDNKPPARKKTHEKLPSINQKQKQIEKQISKLQKAQKLSILPYENQTLKKLKEAKSDQQKMKKYNKKLTLAQKLGLVQAPPLPLTAKDWLAIQDKSRARNDSDNCCSICLQDFKTTPQIILSCSHVFHMECLNSYEKHNKIKSCPICRRRDYQKKVIDDAIRAFTLKSILRIQRVFRGSETRIRVYGQLVDSGYKAVSVRFNRRLIGFKMWRLSHKIQQKIKKNEQFYNKLIKQVQQKFQQSKQSILDQFVEIQRKKLMQQNQIEVSLQKLGIKIQYKKQITIDWQTVKQKGVSRKDDQCSICLMQLWSKPVYLLSCSHMFHVNCIQGFERYAIPGNKNKCPCCRSHYQKKIIQAK